jgi:hypothetical protein
MDRFPGFCGLWKLRRSHGDTQLSLFQCGRGRRAGCSKAISLYAKGHSAMNDTAVNDIEIPESEWQQFCERFTRQHHGWLVGMRQLDTRDLLRGETAAQARVRLFPGNRLLQEVREGRSNDSVEVMVTVGEGADETSYLIEDAVALYSRRAGDAHQGLRIDSNHGKTTLIEFRTAAEPQALDGLAEAER